MAIVPMKKLTLIAMKDDQQAMVRLMQELGCVEVVVGDKEELPGTREMAGSAGQEEDLAAVRAAIRFLTPYAPKKKGFLPDRDLMAMGEFEAMDDAQAREGAREAREMQAELGDIAATRLRIRATMASLEPWEGLKIPFEQIRDTHYAAVQIGTLPPANLPELQEKLALQQWAAQLDTVSEMREGVCLLAAAHKEHAEAFFDLLKASGFVRASFPELTGTAGETLQRLRKELDELAARQAEIEREAGNLAAQLKPLKLLEDKLAAHNDRAQAAGRFLQTEQTFIAQGWVPVPQQELLRGELQKISETFELQLRDPQEGEVFPTATHNGKVVEPFELITNLYSTPDCRELDPNALMAPFYFAFFGMMVSDAGYGIVMAIVATLANKFMRPRGMAGQLARLMIAGGISTFMWGALFGGWFGIELPPLLFVPMQEPIMMLALCFGLGAIHIMTGMGVKAYTLIKEGKVWDAIFDQVTWIVLIIGLPMLALPATQMVGMVLSIAAVVTLILTQGRAKKNIFAKLIGGIGSLYNITSVLSDILSYSRLFALGLATGVIGMVINTIATMLGGNFIGSIFMVAVLIGGHAFNLLINVLGAFVHASRLQYIEFFGKFYTGGGHAFDPLRYRAKNVDLTRQKQAAK